MCLYCHLHVCCLYSVAECLASQEYSVNSMKSITFRITKNPQKVNPTEIWWHLLSFCLFFSSSRLLCFSHRKINMVFHCLYCLCCCCCEIIIYKDSIILDWMGSCCGEAPSHHCVILHQGHWCSWSMPQHWLGCLHCVCIASLGLAADRRHLCMDHWCFLRQFPWDCVFVPCPGHTMGIWPANLGRHSPKLGQCVKLAANGSTPAVAYRLYFVQRCV